MVEHLQTTPSPTEGRRHRILRWLFLVYPPVATFLFATVWYLSAFGGLGAVGVILCLLTPLVCAVWSFRLCRRLAGASKALLAFLFVSELALIAVAFLFCAPHWE